MNTSNTIANRQLREDRQGRQLAAWLDDSARALPHDISERLRVARQQAVEKHLRSAAKVARAPVAQVLGDGTLALGGGDERSFWPRLAAGLSILAVLIGLVTIHTSVGNQLAEDLATIDAAILTDDLPPDAYADPGFAEFLKTQAAGVAQQVHEDS
jgi:nitrogen fixation-related uncharacterized protein